MNKLFELSNVVSKTYMPMRKEHVKDALRVYNNWMSRYNIHKNFDETTFERYFINDIVKSYVIMNDENKVLDFASYFVSSMKTKTKENIYVGYLLTFTSHVES